MIRILQPPHEAPTLQKAAFSDAYLSDHEPPRLLWGGRTILAPAHLHTQLISLQAAAFGTADGRDEYLLHHEGVQYRASRMRARHGEVFVLRRIASELPDLKGLRMPPSVVRRIMEATQNRGIILYSGEVSSGKSTSASAIMVAGLRSVPGVGVTMESPPEFPLEGPHGDQSYCYQLDVPETQFGDAIVRTLRYSPRFVLVGEIRTPEAASAAIRASLTTTAIATVHATSIINTILVMVKLAAMVDGEEFSRQVLGNNINAVIHQRLIHDASGSRLEAKILAIPPELGTLARALIRSGRYEHLLDEIQRLQVLMGKEDAVFVSRT